MADKPPSLQAVHLLFRADPDRAAAGEWVFWSDQGDVEAALRHWVGSGLPRLTARTIDVIAPVYGPAPGGEDGNGEADEDADDDEGDEFDDDEDGDEEEEEENGGGQEVRATRRGPGRAAVRAKPAKRAAGRTKGDSAGDGDGNGDGSGNGDGHGAGEGDGNGHGNGPLRAPVRHARFALRSVEGRALGLLPGLALLSRVEATGPREAGIPVPSDAIVAWSLAAKFALELVGAGRFLPTIEELEASGRFAVTWAVVLGRVEDRERFHRLAAAMPPSAYAWPAEETEATPAAEAGAPPRFADPTVLLRSCLDAVADTLVRAAAPKGLSTRGLIPEGTPPWGRRWIVALTGDDPAFVPEGLPERHLPDELWTWARHALGAGAEAPFQVCFKLEQPADGEPEDAPWRLSYHVQAAHDASQIVPIGSIWQLTDDPARLFGRVVREPHDAVLRALGEAARAFPPIEGSLRRPRPTHVNLRAGGAWLFLADAVPMLTLMGHAVRIPPALDTGGARRLHARLLVSGRPRDTGTSGAVAWNATADFRWEVVLDGQPIARPEFNELVRGKRALARWRDRWVCVSPGDLVMLTKVVHGGPRGEGTLAEALSLALRGTAPIGPGMPEVPVVPVGPLGELVGGLRDRAQVLIESPVGFRGQLRRYQAQGVGWLAEMHRLGLGAILADDMGLGKTVEVLALLCHERATHPDEERPTLLVCPTSVLGNWEREAGKFAPGVPILRHHGPDRARTADALENGCAPGTLVLTTYAIARLDAELLAGVDWARAILDEAQNIKNPSAAQSRAVRTFVADRRFVLTGTPVENRLADLWSLLEFCNPGLLGPLAEFRRAIARPVERFRDPEAAARLRRLVGPFVLRRRKGDPDVAADLPEKLEATVACSLSKEQATLYRKTIHDAWKSILGKSGIQRRGKILALLTALKQICNHPAHYLKEDVAEPARSGKLARLTEMLEEATATGDRALVFTQFVEMGKLLVPHLEKTFGWEVPFLHGGVPARGRDAMVQRFQEDDEAPPVFLLSLRAGGTGLNLTRATHVFHFDHWWNPAVEDQATDRTHRIGQTRAVHVHRLVALGTLEEKIAHMLEAKRGLSEIAIGAGEDWLTEMDDEELRKLLDLSADAVVGSEDA